MAILQYANGAYETISLDLPDIDGVDYLLDSLNLEVTATWEDGTSVTLPTWAFDRANQTASLVPTGVEFATAGLVTLTPNLTAAGALYRLAEVREYVQERGP